MTDVPTIPTTAKSVVSNLRATQANLANFADWQIDFGHRNWSTSGDFPDETQIHHWAPSDSDTMRQMYIDMTAKERI